MVMKVVYNGGCRMTSEQVSLSILHEAPYGLALGLGLSHFVGHLQFLLVSASLGSEGEGRAGYG